MISAVSAPDAPASRRYLALVSGLFLVSGATALIYEVIWVRVLTLTFGSTVYAIGTVLAAFMAGLSLGSYLFGRWADRGHNLLRAYGILEIGIAFFAVISPFLLRGAASFYLRLDPSSFALWQVTALRFWFSFLILLLPTTLMGGTLPILSRHLIRSRGQIESRLGLLYSINTLGGVLGTFLVGFLLIRLFGLTLVVNGTAFINLLVGLAAIALGRRASQRVAPAEPAPASPGAPPSWHRFALAGFFLSGFAAMVYQVAWSRLLVEVIGSATYAFSTILMGFLLGIALGSLIVSYLSRKKQFDLFHFSVIELAIGVTCLLTLVQFALLPPMMVRGLALVGESYARVLALEFLITLSYILIPTTLFGATFPVIAAVFHRGAQSHLGEDIGLIYAANTLGAIFGSVLAAFFFLPFWGSSISIKIAVFLNLAVGAAGLLVSGRRRLAIALSPLLALPLLPVELPRELMDTGVAIYGREPQFSLEERERLVFFKEGLTSTITVRQAADGTLILKTNGKGDASTSIGDMMTQIGAGYFPTLLHPAPEKVLVIGLGSGVTVKAVSASPEVRRADCVEIEPAVFDAARLFGDYNGQVLRDPKVRYFVDDARSHLMASRERYHVIISEPSNPWISGIGNLYTREFYREAANRLEKGGIFCQWVQMYGLRPEDLRMALKTFRSVFPHSTLWHTSIADLFIIGSVDEGALNFDSQSIAARLTGERGRILRSYLSIEEPLDLFSYFITDGAGIEKITAGARINTDDLPLLEFNAPFSLYADTSLSNMDLFMRHLTWPPIRGVDPSQLTLENLMYRKRKNMGL